MTGSYRIPKLNSMLKLSMNSVHEIVINGKVQNISAYPFKYYHTKGIKTSTKQYKISEFLLPPSKKN